MTNLELDLLGSLFDEKFKGIHVKMDAEFSVINAELKQIKNQVTLTNSRVTHLEENVVSLKLKEVSHFTDCPNVLKIENIGNELIEYRIFKKYPKIAIGMLAITCFIVIATTMITIEKFKVSATTMQQSSLQNMHQIEKLDSILIR